MNWTTDETDTLMCTVNIKSGQGDGTYTIFIIKRPVYCDRGDWLINVQGYNSDLDYCDGFPRYFFGTEEQVKQQMETWLLRRQAYLNTLSPEQQTNQPQTERNHDN